MDSFAECVKRAIEKRVEDGHFFVDGNRSTVCSTCGMSVTAVPATCWGQEVSGFFMAGTHDHGPVSPDPATTAVSTSVRRMADFVVMLPGAHPAFITADEKERYLELAARGIGIIEIRRYVFDRLYPIMPYEDWENEQRRRDREVDAHMALID